MSSYMLGGICLLGLKDSPRIVTSLRIDRDDLVPSTPCSSAVFQNRSSKHFPL